LIDSPPSSSFDTKISRHAPTFSANSLAFLSLRRSFS
jgi:hypothetical protein